MKFRLSFVPSFKIFKDLNYIGQLEITDLYRKSTNIENNWILDINAYEYNGNPHK